MNFFYKPLSPPNPKPPISTPTSTAGEREHMFEKVVTPSDVGKLNRLVIPKQHAEKYFPLDSAAGEKGLLLNFDEIGETGKSWRFRYSYWSSSQSYVITKGWSRFVKDKHLDAGDVVSFSRVSGSGENSGNTYRLFIDWRRRPESIATRFDHFHHGISLHRPITTPWCYSTIPPPPFLPPYHRRDLTANNYGPISPNYRSLQHHHGSVVCLDPRGGNCQVGPTVFGSVVPVANENAAPKRLRLFGVNMDCTPVDQHVLGDPSSSANGVTTNFLDKGKSLMSLDFHI